MMATITNDEKRAFAIYKSPHPFNLDDADDDHLPMIAKKYK